MIGGALIKCLHLISNVLTLWRDCIVILILSFEWVYKQRTSRFVPQFTTGNKQTVTWRWSGGKKIYTYIYRKFWTMTGIKVNAGWRFIISFPCFASTATTSTTIFGGKVSVSSMTQVHTTYKSEFLIKSSVHLDNFTEFRKLDIFDSKLTVWEDYLVGIQLLLTGKIWKSYANDMQNDFKNFQM